MLIEIFLLHEVRSDPDWENRAGAWHCLQDAKAKGLVRAIGLSTHHVDVAAKAAETEELDILFPLINLKVSASETEPAPAQRKKWRRKSKKQLPRGKASLP
jgi:aryl-alcohol dehydrogenase-like predicted oxidoreductase